MKLLSKSIILIAIKLEQVYKNHTETVVNRIKLFLGMIFAHLTIKFLLKY